MDLNDKQSKFIDTYLASKNMTETCKKLKISRNTAYNYLKDEIVKDEINKRRTELMSDTTLFLQGNLQECSNMLMAIVKSENTTPQVKINAINSIFNNCNKLIETSDILVRLNNIEEQLKVQEERENE